MIAATCTRTLVCMFTVQYYIMCTVPEYFSDNINTSFSLLAILIIVQKHLIALITANVVYILVKHLRELRKK